VPKNQIIQEIFRRWDFLRKTCERFVHDSLNRHAQGFSGARRRFSMSTPGLLSWSSQSAEKKRRVETVYGKMRPGPSFRAKREIPLQKHREKEGFLVATLLEMTGCLIYFRKL
jgi:hypothetical protein